MIINDSFTAKRNHLDKETVDSIHALRYKVFRERLEWNVPTIGNIEVDGFDALDPVYVLHKDEHINNNIIGCMRLLSTKGFYMLQDIFPELLRGESSPSDPQIMEISRFAVDTELSSDYKTGISRVTISLLRSAYFYAIENNIKQFVLVTTVAIERYLRRIGIPTERFGDKKSTYVGKELSVALKMDINGKYRSAVLDT